MSVAAPAWPFGAHSVCSGCTVPGDGRHACRGGTCVCIVERGCSTWRPITAGAWVSLYGTPTAVSGQDP